MSLCGRETTIYFIRHAESDRTVRDGRIRPLTEQGLRDAEALVARFEGIAIDAFYSSPYRRAVETVLPLARSRGCEVITREGLHERISDSEPIEDWPAFLLRQWSDFSYTISDGEALGIVQARNLAALHRLLEECQGHTIAIGTHGVALSTIIHHYDPGFGYAELMRLLPVLPYVMRFEFCGDAFLSMCEMAMT